jgi:hypothetical protein
VVGVFDITGTSAGIVADGKAVIVDVGISGTAEITASRVG